MNRTKKRIDQRTRKRGPSVPGWRALAVTACVFAGGVVQEARATPVIYGQMVEFVVERERGVFEVPLDPGIVTRIDFPSAVTRITGEVEPWVYATRDGKSVEIKPRRRIPRILNLHAEAGGLHVSFTLLPAPEPTQAISLAVVTPITEVEQRNQAIEQRDRAVEQRDRAVEQRDRAVEQRDRALKQTARSQDMNRRLAAALVDRARAQRAGVPRGEDATTAARPCVAQVDAGATQAGADKVLVAFGIVNGCASTYRMSSVAVYDVYKSVNHADTPLVWGPSDDSGDSDKSDEPAGTPGSAAGDMLAMIPSGEDDELVWPAFEDREVIAEIAPGEDVLGLVMVDARALAPGPLSVVVTQTDGLQPLVATINQWRLEPVEPEPENIERRTLYAKGFIGAMWLEDKLMPGEIEPAFLSGAGARLTYGLTAMLDLETELIYARSGTVSFGDVEQSASFVRVQFGGLLRFGETYMPFLRAGLGLYGASQRQVMNGVEESDIDVDLTFSGGLGLDMRLGQTWTAGGALSIDKPLGADSRSIELGLHLGYSWKP